jgi:hypothetical protein
VWAGWLRREHPDWISVPVLIVDCVSVAVAFIPEGLPIAVTASLTITANIMKRNKILCKSLKTVETLGAVNVICSDKTGTLTENKMSVTHYLVGKQVGTAKEAPGLYEGSKILRALANLSAVCNAAEFDASTVAKPLAERKINGDATDSAILRFVEHMTPVSSLRAYWRTVYQVTFNSKNKFAINVVQSDTAPEEGIVLMIKGAPDVLLPRCGSYLDKNGSVERISNEDRISLEQTKDTWSSQGKRVILLAKKRLDDLRFNPVDQPREYENDIMGRAASELILVGLVAIVDPPRPEIPEVVRTLRGAGIRVFMVTGDFKLTAAAIAADCGIITQPQNKIDDVTNLAFSEDYLDSAGIKEQASFDTDRSHALGLRPRNPRRQPMGQTLQIRRGRLRPHNPRAQTTHRQRTPSPRLDRRHDRRRRQRRPISQSRRHRHRHGRRLRHRHRSRRHGAHGFLRRHRRSRQVRPRRLRQPQENHRLPPSRRLFLRILARHHQRHVRPAANPLILPHDHHLLLHRLRRRDRDSVRETRSRRPHAPAAKREERPPRRLEADPAGLRLRRAD